MNLFELQAVLTLNSSNYTAGLSTMETKTNTFLNKIQGVTNRVAGAWGSVKTTVQGAKSLMSPIIDVISDAVSAYGDYEQAVGGVQKLYGSASKTISENARKAFKTAGVSITDYMNLCIMSGATMLKSVGEDSEKAAEMMDLAIIDMSDNVNALGTTMESVQNAYRGFSRGNWTMLDNLALGYSGTTQGMMDLLNDAAEINEEFARTAKFKLDEKGHLEAKFSDIVKAIHIIQEYRNIAGTSQAEAASTQLGSKAALEAAKQNMLIVLADKESTQEEKDEAAKAYADAMGKYLKNLMPVILAVVDALIKAVQEILPKLLDKLPALVDFLVKILLQVFNNQELMGAIIKALAYAVVSGIAALVDILLTGLIRIFNKDYAPGSSAFGEWGVYEWLQNAFGFGEEKIKRFGGFEDELNEVGTAYANSGEGRNFVADTSTGTVRVYHADGTMDEYESAADAIRDMNAEMYGPSASDTAETFAYGGKTYTVPEGDTAGQWRNFLKGMEVYYGGEGSLTPDNIRLLLDQLGGELTEMNIPKAELEVTSIDAEAHNVTLAGGIKIYMIRGMDTLDEGVDPGAAAYAEDGIYHAKGLWSVPYDDYAARLHRDEMVLTASQARAYRNGGDSDAVVEAIRGLRNDITKLQIVVGEKTFGRTVVDYSGKRMSGYIGSAEDKTAAGYGWG